MAPVRRVPLLLVVVVLAACGGSTNPSSVQFTGASGRVSPSLVVARSPKPDRAPFGTVVGNDYLATPFLADFWLDDAGRIRHVRVDYRTAGGGRIVVNAKLSNFGRKIDLTLPAASE